MGPHSFKCGKSLRPFHPTSRFICFNGAALFQVRKEKIVEERDAECPVLQWGRTLSSAESRQIAVAAARPLPSFNGAALFQVRKARCKSRTQSIERRASMGPHSFKCGKRSDSGESSLPVWLRASMGPHSFKCGKEVSPDKARRLARMASMGPHSFKCGKLSDGIASRPPG